MEHKDLTSWERQHSELHASCKVYNILRERWTNKEQKAKGDFFVMEVNDWALTIALTGDGKCVLVRQFRFGSGDFTWELPAGVIDPGEDPLEGGIRELYEETGYRGDSAEVLSVIYPNPAIQRNRCHIILIKGACKIDGGDPDPHELFEVREVGIETLYSWARDGTISHAIVHAALFFLREYLRDEPS